MIIDCHGHYTTAPKELQAFRDEQIKGNDTPAPLKITDDQIRETIQNGQLKMQQERGSDITIFSPRAAGMGHHIGGAKTSEVWTDACNTLIHRVVKLFPKNFIGVAQLPQTPGVAPANCIPELERCVKEFGFIGCNLNPDPSGGKWNDPPMTDKKWWYPFYEKMVELDVPAMVHVSMSCNPNFHTTGAHYINGDTTAFMQFIMSDIFKDFPTLEVHHPAWRRRGALSLGPVSRPGAGREAPALRRSCVLKNVYLRHLRLSPAGHRPADQGGAGRQHSRSPRK